jgi:hypothetical protein
MVQAASPSNRVPFASVVMHQQSRRQLQVVLTSLAITEVLDAAVRFFSSGGGVYSAFLETRGPTHVVLRGQGGEEIAIGAQAAPGGTSVSGSSYLFDQQVARFLDSLPPAHAEEAVTAAPTDATAGVA